MTRAHSIVLTAALAALVLTMHLACGSSDGQSAAAPTPELAPEAQWLRANAVPLAHVDASESLDELEPLRAMIGNARVVALGEATHGTKQFFQMKHRILRFLVERMGFSAFAIEATWPEANRIDRYVRTGKGRPKVLLSGLYFWTWNTQSVLDMILWMREHNKAGGDLGFYGFDMQYPGMAIENVRRFIATADGAAGADFERHLECLGTYANDATGRFPSPGYGAQPQAYRDACLKDLQWVENTIVARRGAYAAVTSEADWALAAQSTRVAIQYEQMVSRRATRDSAMADNVLWLLHQLGPQAKLVLWAHNGHVSTLSGAMGLKLRHALGNRLFTMGFDFAHGSFTALRQSGTSYQGLEAISVDEPAPLSYEAYFSSAAMPEFMLDLRRTDLAATDSQWLAGPRPFRSIGCCYDTNIPNNYWIHDARLPGMFDAVTFFETSTPTTVLPFEYPTDF